MPAELNYITLKKAEQNDGQIDISPQVIEIIAGIASVQVKGVNRMHGSFTNSVNELFGKKERGKGVKLEFNQNKLNVDVFLFLDYGISVPDVALEIQKQVRQQLLFMTDLKVGSVNVHVQGMVAPKNEKVDTEKLFDNGDKD
ncbi:Asp23/Gls24 family envelope stress response protein [Lactobacillus sp. S2-2]|uniref:Asp23/Gls24 family envelope stress response protein n=1 Tax=Lactobacillus sp. S2-2 TaxID=2692917 RepID=UPI001F3D55A6|nr:Asp23/Gls24 family envelope stress response protein [Lactobacillus sp. S2-2]MCF6515112.1 Asp23/Gls24 family envelope stress response protein [Lactobacillus sp. S2-2]